MMMLTMLLADASTPFSTTWSVVSAVTGTTDAAVHKLVDDIHKAHHESPWHLIVHAGVKYNEHACATWLKATIHNHPARFSLPDADGVLRVRLCRHAAAGEQLFLSYGGALANKELLLHYGFTLDNNPHDEVPLSFEEEEAEAGPDGPLEARGRDAALALRGLLMARWGIGWDHALRLRRRLPSRLLALLRLLTAQSEELISLARTPSAAPGGGVGVGPRHRRLSLESERGALETLSCTLEALLEQLPGGEEGGADGEGDAASLAHVGAYLSSQRAILTSAVAAAGAMLEQLRAEEA